MRRTILVLVGLVPVVAASLFYGWLEAGANMVEMMVLPLSSTDPSAGGALWLGAPILAICLLTLGAVMVAVPLTASCLTASLAGWGLRQSDSAPVPQRALHLMVIACGVLTIGFVVVGSRQENWLPDRPRNRPKTPVAVLALLAGGNAALSALAAGLTIRAMSSKPKPQP